MMGAQRRCYACDTGRFEYGEGFKKHSPSPEPQGPPTLNVNDRIAIYNSAFLFRTFSNSFYILFIRSGLRT